MTALILIAIDLVAMAALVFGLYFPRHRRADLVAAFLGVNVGVLAVTIILANSTVSAGLASASSVFSRSSDCVRIRSRRRKSPTTSPRWLSAC